MATKFLSGQSKSIELVKEFLKRLLITGQGEL